MSTFMTLAVTYYNIILLVDCKHFYSDQYLLKMLSYNFILIIH